MEDNTHAEHPEGFVEGGVTPRNIGEYFIVPQGAFKERALAQLVEAIEDFFERPVWNVNEMESMRMYEGGRNTLDKFRNGRKELLGYGGTRIHDLAANGN